MTVCVLDRTRLVCQACATLHVQHAHGLDNEFAKLFENLQKPLFSKFRPSKILHYMVCVSIMHDVKGIGTMGAMVLFAECDENP